MVVADVHLLVDPQGALLDAADRHAANIVVIIDRRDEHRGGQLGVALGGLDVVDDRIHERQQVGARHLGGDRGGAVAAGAEDHRAVELRVGRAEVHQQLEHLVDDLVDARVGSVDLVDDHDDREVEVECLAQHEAGLGHRALRRVDEQQHAVHHLEHPLHFAAEIGVSRGVHDVDLHALVFRGGVLRQDRDAALPLDVVRVHHAVLHRLVLPEGARLLEHPVDQRRLAVVDVRDNGNIA